MKPIAPPLDVHRAFERPPITDRSPIGPPMRQVDAGGGAA